MGVLAMGLLASGAVLAISLGTYSLLYGRTDLLLLRYGREPVAERLYDWYEWAAFCALATPECLVGVWVARESGGNIILSGCRWLLEHVN